MKEARSDIPVEYILYGSFIKFVELDKLIPDALRNSDAYEVNVFIDLNKFLLPIYNCINYENKYSIASIIINYGLHFRYYFKKFNVYANIIFVYPDPDSYNMFSTINLREFGSGVLNRIYSNAEMLSIVKENIGIVELLCPYLPNFFFKRGTAESHVLITHLIRRVFSSKPIPNIVVSASNFMHQVTQYTNCIVLKRKRELKSYWYNDLNTFDYFIKDTRHYNGLTGLPSRFLPLCMALNGLKCRDLNPIFNIRTTINIIKSFSPAIKLSYANIHEIYNEVLRCMKLNYSGKSELIFNQFDARYKAVNLSYLLQAYNCFADSKDYKFMNRLNDPKSVRYINDKYFKDIPLNLQYA